MVLACQNITKSFGDHTVISNLSFHIEDREKVALVGINGAGKSTLLKIIMNEMSKDDGEVLLGKGKSIGYLSQHPSFEEDTTIYDAMLEAKQDVISIWDRMQELQEQMADLKDQELTDAIQTYDRLTQEYERKNGYSYKSEILGVLNGLGFSEAEYTQKIDSLSGGQKTRVALGQLLLSTPDIILLDEPTNHLDISSIRWLEGFLQNYKGAVLIVSHDRYFLNRVVTKVVEIDRSKGSVFQGNYSAYAEKKANRRKEEQAAYFNQQKEIKHQEEVIAKLRSFNREKSIKRAESRVKQLDKIDRIEKPIEINTSMRITLEPNILSGNDVLTVNGLSKSFDQKDLFSNLDFEIKRGEKVALIGNNGTGKTTILKIINRMIHQDAGKTVLGAKVKIGYYDQAQQTFNESNNIFDEVKDSFPDLTDTKVRSVLAAFLFTKDDVFKQISALSGGERGRLSLAKLMLSSANFLILDEPTNHLDIESKEILEDAIKNYTGTVFYVSHDRYFVNQTATRILELENNELHEYVGNYDYYLAKKEELSMANATATDNSSAQTANLKNQPTKNQLSWQEQKENEKRLRKIKNDLAKAEDKIEELEQRIEELNAELLLPEHASNTAKLTEITTEQATINEELETLYETWEELTEQLQ